MFEIIPYSENLDLSIFYNEAAKRGHINNSSKKRMVDCFANEDEKQVWILYYDNIPIGSVAAHSFFDVMGPNCYRIAARTCVITDLIKDHPYSTNLRTRSVILKHQNPTSQFLIPKCLEWTPLHSRVFITTNKMEEGTQKKVHRTFAPLMEKTGQMSKVKEVFYRGTYQTVWEFDKDKFYQEKSKYPIWT